LTVVRHFIWRAEAGRGHGGGVRNDRATLTRPITGTFCNSAWRVVTLEQQICLDARARAAGRRGRDDLTAPVGFK
jgi:hypothetical protein